VTLLFPITPAPKDRIQSRLFSIAAVVLVAYSLALTLAPAVRLHNWMVTYNWRHWAGMLVWLAGFSLLHRSLMRRAPERDPYIVPIAGLLTGIGILTIWRLNVNLGARQTVWLAISIGLFILGLRFPKIFGLLRKYKYVWAVGALVITGLTFFFGTYPGGTGPRLWLGCCGVYFQPSEVLKLCLIIYLAAYLADRWLYQQNLLQLLMPTLLVAGAALLLLVSQRDLGTASLFIVLYALMVYLSSCRRSVLLGGRVAGGSRRNRGLPVLRSHSRARASLAESLGGCIGQFLSNRPISDCNWLRWGFWPRPRPGQPERGAGRLL